MGKLFGNLTSTDNMEEAQDRVGGFQPLAADAYKAKIKMAYAIESAKGANGVVILADVNGQEHRETVWVTNRNGENFFKDKEDPSKKIPLPGFTTVDDLCLLATGEGLGDQDAETKKVKIYDPQERKEVPTDVPVLVNLLGKEVVLGLLHKKEFKQEKDDSGNFSDTDKVREYNEIDKVFHPETLRTVNEYRHEIETPDFHKAWVERNKGKVRDKTQGGSSGGTSGSGRPNAANSDNAPKKKLFGKG